MLRGFRWQLVAFILALVVFAAAAIFRLSRQTSPAQLPDVTPAATIAPTEPVAPTLVADSNGSTQPRADASVYREGIVGSVQRLNPLLAHLNPPRSRYIEPDIRGLFAFNDYGEVVPDLAADLVVRAMVWNMSSGCATTFFGRTACHSPPTMSYIPLP